MACSPLRTKISGQQVRESHTSSKLSQQTQRGINSQQTAYMPLRSRRPGVVRIASLYFLESLCLVGPFAPGFCRHPLHEYLVSHGQNHGAATERAVMLARACTLEPCSLPAIRHRMWLTTSLPDRPKAIMIPARISAHGISSMKGLKTRSAATTNSATMAPRIKASVNCSTVIAPPPLSELGIFVSPGVRPGHESPTFY